MNRFAAKLMQGAARLAFWRKPASALPADPGSAKSAPAQQDASASVIPPAPKLGWLARVKRAFRRKQPATLPLLVDQIIESGAPNAGQAESADPEPAADQTQQSAPGSAPVPADIADAVPVSRMVRVLGLLGNKWVWIPGVSVIVLAIIVTLALMLVQSTQEKDHLQAELAASQKALKTKIALKEPQPAPARPPEAHAADAHPPPQVEKPVPIPINHAEEPGPAPTASTPTASTTESVQPPAAHAEPAPLHAVGKAKLPAAADLNCDVSDKASVTKNLKNCIDAFNKATRQ